MVFFFVDLVFIWFFCLNHPLHARVHVVIALHRVSSHQIWIIPWSDGYCVSPLWILWLRSIAQLWNSRTRPLDLRSNAPGWSCLRYSVLILFFLICACFFKPSDLNMMVTVLLVFISLFCFFLKTIWLILWLWWVDAVIKSGPPDSSKGPD